MNTEQKIVMLKDREWSEIDGEGCRVVAFTPMASIENGEVKAVNQTTPYASVLLECKKMPTQIEGFITHKIDFIHLWVALKERVLTENEEVIIIWSKKHLKTSAKLFSAVMPKLWVMICPKGAFELMNDPNFKPELNGRARWNVTKPIIDWKPEVMT